MTSEIQPIMALNPFSNKLVNVYPIFDFLESFDGADGAEELVDRAIRLLTIFANPEEFTEDWQMIMINLYFLRDMFKRMGECEISMPKQKGSKG